MGEQPVKRPKGRPVGSVKDASLKAIVSQLRVSEEMYEWLEAKGDDVGLVKITDTVRMVLTEAMRREKGKR
jgi:hypothetical protein